MHIAEPDREDTLEEVRPSLLTAAITQQDFQHGTAGGRSGLLLLVGDELFSLFLGIGSRLDALVLVLLVVAPRRILG